MTFRTLVAAAAVAALPTVATAITINDGDTAQLSDQPFTFMEEFSVGDSGGTRSISFENNLGLPAVLELQAVALQFTGNFESGVSFDLNGENFDFAEGDSGANTFSTILAAGETETLLVTFGDVLDIDNDNEGSATIAFDARAAAIPLPASAFLFAGALGGLALLRRKSETAA